MDEIVIHCDGSSSHRNLYAGFAAIVEAGHETFTIKKGLRNVSCIMAELLGALRSLEFATKRYPDKSIVVYSDCKHLVDVINSLNYNKRKKSKLQKTIYESLIYICASRDVLAEVRHDTTKSKIRRVHKLAKECMLKESRK